MPFFKYTIRASEHTRIHYYWEVASGGIVSPSSKSCLDDDQTKGQTSSSCLYKSRYEMLAPPLKSCLDYCALLFSVSHDHYWRPSSKYVGAKKGIVRVMVAEVLIEEKGSGDDSCLEEVASSFIDQLVGRGMLLQNFNLYYLEHMIEIPEEYYKLCVVERDEEDFLARNSLTPIHVSIDCSKDTDISRHLKNFRVQSLFFYSGGYSFSPEAIMDTICGLNSLLVLEWFGLANNYTSYSKIEELINLKYFTLTLFNSLANNTLSLSNFQQLQTLELSGVFNDKIFEEAGAIETLRHLSCQIFQFPKGIGRLVNLQTLYCWYAIPDQVIDELSSLNQLRRLHVQIADENVEKLLKTFTTMEKLISLSISLSLFPRFDSISPLLEPFSPPPYLQELRLEGALMELPHWIASLENLTTLVLTDSQLKEEPSPMFQILPNLKFLYLYYAYKTELMGKEFCTEGGFSKLEILEIKSYYLVGCSEIAKGAFPSLTSFSCSSKMMRFFPEGVQYTPKLERLELDVHEDLIRRLKGDENYKINHIPSVFSVE